MFRSVPDDVVRVTSQHTQPGGGLEAWRSSSRRNDNKMAGYDKLIPPEEVIAAELDKAIEIKIRNAITARILRDAGFEDQVATALAAIPKPDKFALEIGIHDLFTHQPDREWRDHIGAVATELTEEVQ